MMRVSYIAPRRHIFIDHWACFKQPHTKKRLLFENHIRQVNRYLHITIIRGHFQNRKVIWRSQIQKSRLKPTIGIRRRHDSCSPGRWSWLWWTFRGTEWSRERTVLCCFGKSREHFVFFSAKYDTNRLTESPFHEARPRSISTLRGSKEDLWEIRNTR